MRIGGYITARKETTHLQSFKFNPRDSKKKFYSDDNPSKNVSDRMRQCISTV